MKMSLCARSLCAAALAMGTLGGLGRPAAGGVPAYSLVGSFQLPAPGAAFDVMSDGRVMAINGDQLLVQDGLHGSTWSAVGSLPSGSVSAFGASFLRISPDGQTVAVGDNNFGASASVHVVSTASLSTSGPSAIVSALSPNFEASWRDNSRLLVSGFGAEAIVNQITLGASPTVRTLVSDFAGASGGVVSDGVNLYTSNGFAFGGGSTTGDIRAFSLAALDGSATPLSFETAGLPVAFGLSGASLDFDAFGNLLVGGGDTTGGAGGIGFAGVIDAGALANALLGGSVAMSALNLAPGSASDSHSPRFNGATGEILVSIYDNTTFSGGSTVYRFAVPAPGVVGVALVSGVYGARRRRRA